MMNNLARTYLALATLCWLATSPASAQSPAPVMVSQQEVFELQPAAPSNCVSIPRGHYSIVLSLTRLNQFVASKPSGWKTEEERMALISGNRARKLIDVVSTQTDLTGCKVVGQSVPSDAAYLILSEMRGGFAAVVDTTSGVFLDHLDAHTSGVHCSGPACGARGDIWVVTPGDRFPILTLMMWIG